MKRTFYKDPDVDGGAVRSRYDYEPEAGVFRAKTQHGPWKRGRAVGGRSGGYIKLKWGGRQVLAHRVAWIWMTGEWPDGLVDHIDGDGLNNRWSNLRLATNAENLWNRGRQINCTSGRKGAFYNRRRKQWFAQIKVNGQLHFLGYHESRDQAAKAYAGAASRLHGAFARVD